MNTSNPRTTSRIALLLQFIGGWLYLAVIAAFLSAATEIGFPLVFSAIVCGALFSIGLALVWLIGWALRDDTRPGQFGIRSLLFLTVYVALYSGAARWLVTNLPNGEGNLPTIALLCLMVTMISIPVLLFWTESLMWLAAWTVHRDCVQSWLSRRRRIARRAEPHRE